VLTVCEADADLRFLYQRGISGGGHRGGGGVRKLAHLGVQFEPAVGGEKHDAWWTEWIFRRQPNPEVIQSPLEICAGRSTQGAMPLLRAHIYIKCEQLRCIAAVGGENTHKDVVLRPRAGAGREGEHAHANILDRGGHGVARTSNGAAVYSVLGSFASSRASCMMRLTAGVVVWPSQQAITAWV
jgi:hypothetical protein